MKRLDPRWVRQAQQFRLKPVEMMGREDKAVKKPKRKGATA